jgi:ubiquinone/menaquinone biosynthesis C-methylase UbiE
LIPEKYANQLFQRTPRAVRRYVQRIWYFPQDLLDRVRGQRDPLQPPRGYRFDGAESFARVGEEMLEFFRTYGKLSGQDRVLDLGCGIGRIAIPLTRYLSAETRYVGIDINQDDLRWCRRNLTPRHPNFEFLHADVHSLEYNPKGATAAKDYRVPFPDASFDFVCAISLFTHLTEADAANYAREISRVLAPGGRCLLTFFLINPASSQAIAEKRTALDFQPHLGTTYCHDATNPEAAIAFDEEAVLSTLNHLGLAVSAPIYGYWANPSGPPTYQDLVVAIRTEAPLPVVRTGRDPTST